MSNSPLALNLHAENWGVSPISDNAIFIKDGTHGTHKRVSKGIPLLSAKNITPSGKIYWDAEDSQVSDDDYHKIHSKYELAKFDLLLTVVGTLGRSALVTGEGKFTIQRSVAVIRINQHRVLPSFIYQFSSTDFFQKQLELRSNATAQAGVYLGELAKIPLPVPPLPEQQKIAAILTSVDEVIEKTQAQIDKLKDLKTAMMQELLLPSEKSGVGTKQGTGDGASYIQHTEFKDSPVGRIPKSWDCCLLDCVAKRGSGHTPDKQKPEYWNEGLKWVSLTDSSKLDQLYIRDTSKKISQLGIDNSSATMHPEGTVVMARDAGIGKSAIMTSSMAVSQHFMAWVCGEKLNNYFLYYLLQFWKPKFEAIAMGSTIKTIGLPYFKKLQIPLPSLTEQHLISNSLKSVDEKIFTLKRKHKSLTDTKKALMQDLLTGKVRVKLD